MADVKISGLPASTVPLAGTEVLPIVQGGTTKQVSIANVTAGRAMAASSLTTATVQATSSGGLALKNSGGTTQLSLGAGGGDNITLSVATNITPANAAVAISPTGTGTVTINPAAASTMDNVAIGGTTALAGTFTGITLTATPLPIASGGTALATAPPMFAAYSDSNQNPASATATKVVFGTESFDTNSNFASSRFTATIAGYYQFSACAACAADTLLSKVLLQFYKNGAAQIDIVGTSLSSATSLSTDAPSSFSTSSLVYLAVNDYVEVYATVTGTGGNRYVFASNAGYPTVFTGALIR